jgi:hypothetical protein
MPTSRFEALQRVARGSSSTVCARQSPRERRRARPNLRTSMAPGTRPPQPRQRIPVVLSVAEPPCEPGMRREAVDAQSKVLVPVPLGASTGSARRSSPPSRGPEASATTAAAVASVPTARTAMNAPRTLRTTALLSQPARRATLPVSSRSCQLTWPTRANRSNQWQPARRRMGPVGPKARCWAAGRTASSSCRRSVPPGRSPRGWRRDHPARASR